MNTPQYSTGDTKTLWSISLDIETPISDEMPKDLRKFILESLSKMTDEELEESIELYGASDF